MSDFYKDFLREAGGNPNQTQGPRVTLGALGKHPGWDDHIDGLLDTESLALFKNIFYIQAIGREIDSGAWDKPEIASDLIGFDHYLAWVRGDQFLLGRLWASSDGRGRTKYPMILCAQVKGLAWDWALQYMLPKLDQTREACQSVRTAGEVRQIIQKAQADLRELAASAPTRAGSAESLDRAGFLAGPELGPGHVGLMRILHELESNFFAYKKAKSGKTIGADVRAQHIRVPRNAASPAESLLAWREFFNLLFPKDLPLLFVAPAGKPWVDVFAGAPTANEIFPLRVQSVGLASSVPYEIGPEIKSSCADLVSHFETGAAMPTGQTIIIKKSDAKPSAPSASWDTPPPARRMNLKWLGAGGGGLLLLVIIGFILFGHGHPPAPIVATPPKPEINQPSKPQEIPPAPKPQESPPKVTPPLAASNRVEAILPPPQLSMVKDETIESGGKFQPLPFTVTDGNAPLEKLTAALESSDTQWLPANSLSLDRSGSNWAVRIDPSPSRAGAAEVAVIVTDGAGKSATNRFHVTVTEVSWVPPVIERQGPERQVVRVGSEIAPVLFQVSDRKTPVEKLHWSFDSSNPALLPVEGMHESQAGALWQVTAAVAPGKTGAASITVTITNEGGLAATNQFMVVVTTAPPAPRFDQPLSDVRIMRGQHFQGVVKVSDGDVPAGKLTLKPRVEPFGLVAVNVRGEGAERTVELDARDAAPGRGKLILELSNGETSATNVSLIELVPAEPPVFVSAPQRITEIQAGKESPPFDFVISNRSGTAEQIHFSVSSRDAKAISGDHLTISHHGSVWQLKMTPNDGASGQISLEAVATDALGGSATNLFQVTVAAPAGLFRNSVGMEFVWVDNLPGTEQASWDSVHVRGGWVGQYLVTQKDFSSVMHTNPSAHKGGDLEPVENMSAADVDEFCHNLAAQDQSGHPIPAGWSYQLLTLEQWKFCAENCPATDCVLSTPALKRQNPEPVGTLSSNALGLFDIIGNVYEVTTSGPNKVKWMSGASFEEKQARKATVQFNPGIWAGFRIAITPTVETP